MIEAKLPRISVRKTQFHLDENVLSWIPDLVFELNHMNRDRLANTPHTCPLSYQDDKKGGKYRTKRKRRSDSNESLPSYH